MNAGMRSAAMFACLILMASKNPNARFPHDLNAVRAIFETYVKIQLVPTLQRGDVAVFR